MSHLGRKVAFDKWLSRAGLAADEAPADPLTGGDPRTKENALSFWESHDGADDALRRAALGYAASCERLDSLSIVVIERADLASKVSLENRPSRVPALGADMAACHVEAVGLDTERVAHVAKTIDRAIRLDRARRFTRGEVARLLKQAIQLGSIRPKYLQPGVRRLRVFA